MADMQKNPEEETNHLPPEGGYKGPKENNAQNGSFQENPNNVYGENASSANGNQNYGWSQQNSYPNQNQYNQYNQPNPWNQQNGYNQNGAPYQNNGPYYQNNGYNGYGAMPPKPDSYLVWSILVTLLCCIVFGIIAIIESTKVDSLWNQGRVDDAYRASNRAKLWCIWGVVAGFIISVFYVIITIFSIGIQY